MSQGQTAHKQASSSDRSSLPSLFGCSEALPPLHSPQQTLRIQEPPENRIDPLDISRYTKPSGKLSRSSTRPGTSTFSRLYSLRIRDGRPHFRAPPSYNPPSTVETTCSAVDAVSTPACPPIAKVLSRSSNRTSSPLPTRATHLPSIREAYEVTPFVFTQQDGVQKDVDVQDMSSVSPPLHVQTQLELHAKRRGSYPMEKVMDEPPFEVPTALPAVPKRTVKLDDEPRPTVGQRRAFFVVNQSSKSSLRSSGVPVPSSHQPPQMNSEKPQDADAEYVVNSSRKWEKSRSLSRTDDEDVPDNSRPNVDLEAQAPQSLQRRRAECESFPPRTRLLSRVRPFLLGHCPRRKNISSGNGGGRTRVP